jgi:hypothetical protein
VSARRVAVVVVAGVGDNPDNDAAERVTNGLTRWGGFSAPTERSLWFAVEGKENQPLEQFTTMSPNGTETDVYEFWWADLSRFPGAMRSFLAAFAGLFLALPSVGRTALRDARGITEARQENPSGWRALDFRLLGILAWIVGVPVVVLTATLLMVVGALGIALMLRTTSPVIAAGGTALYGIVLAAAGLLLLRHYQRESGRVPAFALGIVGLAGAVGVCVWQIVDRGIVDHTVELALADTVTVFVTYPLRILWLAVVLAIVLVTVFLGVRLLVDRSETRLRRTTSVVATLGGPLGFAMLMAVLSAAVGAALGKLGQSVTWDSTTGTPLCLQTPDSWYWQHCGPGKTAWAFGSNLLQDSILSLICASAIAAGVLVVLALCMVAATLVRPKLDPLGDVKAERQAGRITNALRVFNSRWTCWLLLLACLVAAYAAAGAWFRFFPFFGWIRNRSELTPAMAAVLGGSVTTFAVAARLMGLSPRSLVSDSPVPRILRAILDKPYDIATFLREPLGSRHFGSNHGEQPEVPRQKMLGRFRALADFIDQRHYDRIVFVAHSQGTVLSTTLLAERGFGNTEVSLMTFGCPLRQLYGERFPSQWAWVGDLHDQALRREYVTGVTREWVNVAAAGDPVGRTVFEDPPAPWPAAGDVRPFQPGTPHLFELRLGAGGHTSYWTSKLLYERLRKVIEDV